MNPHMECVIWCLFQNLYGDYRDAKMRIMKYAEESIGGHFGVICAPGEFSYVTKTRLFCLYSAANASCFIFLTEHELPIYWLADICRSMFVGRNYYDYLAQQICKYLLFNMRLLWCQLLDCFIQKKEKHKNASFIWLAFSIFLFRDFLK